MIYTVFKVDGSALFQSARIDGADFLNFDTRKGRDIHPPYFCGSRHLCQNVLPMCFRVAPSMQGFLSPKFPSLRNIHPVGCARFFLFPLVSECPWLHNFQMSSNTVLVGIVIWISNSVFLHLKFFIHFWAIYSCIFMSWLGLQLLPQECGTYSRGALEDFLGIPPFQLCFEVTCSHFWGVAPSILAFLGLGLQVSPRECAVYSCGVLVDFLQILQFQQFVVWLATLFGDCGNVLRWLAAPFGVAPSIPAFLGFGWLCMFSTVFW